MLFYCIRMVRTETGKQMRKEYERGGVYTTDLTNTEFPSVGQTVAAIRSRQFSRTTLSCALRAWPRTGKNDGVRHQHLEIGGGIANSLTTVGKDSMVLIVDDLYRNRNMRIYGECSPSIRAERGGLKVMEEVYDKALNQTPKDCRIRIRKLTPRECWRLMGFADEDFDKAQSVNSNTQLYKQAGNSIVVPVLMAIFKEMIDNQEAENESII